MWYRLLHLVLAAMCLLAAHAKGPVSASAGAQVPPSRDADTATLGTYTTQAAGENAVAIDRGVAFLRQTQQPDGSWGPGMHAGGRAALACLALINSGVGVDDPAVRRSVEFLIAQPLADSQAAVYEVSLRLAVMSLLPERLHRGQLQRDAEWLQRAMITVGANDGLYDYTASRQGRADYSNSQYGVLGMWYAAEAGIEVNGGYWRRVEAGWRAGQNEDGGWGYTPTGGRSYASMTAAAAATLLVTTEYGQAVETADLRRPPSDTPLQGAMDWLGQNFSATSNTGLGNRWLHYMLFSYERVGEASGQVTFGQTDWFAAGSSHLVRTQQPDGGWNSDLGATVDTAYALLFLSRGRAPVAVQKLSYPPPNYSEIIKTTRWNNRPRDVARFSRWFGRNLERHYNWQIVDAAESADRFDDAPVLYISGDRPPGFDDELLGRLKTFVERGGLIFAVNEGPDGLFNRGIEEQLGGLFAPYAFRDLEPDSPLFGRNFDAAPLAGRVRALGSGVREYVVLLTAGDASRAYHIGDDTGRTGGPQHAVLGNAILLASGGPPGLAKGQSHWFPAAPEGQVPPPRTFRLRRVTALGGNTNPEPAALDHLANRLRHAGVADLVHETTPLAGLRAEPPRGELAVLSAFGDFALDAAEREALKGYLSGGGVLLFDAAGGDVRAGVAFERELAGLFPGSKLTSLPMSHPIFAGVNVPAVQDVRFRGPAQRRPPAGVPNLRVLEQNGRVTVLLTRYDLAAGLAGVRAEGVAGYVPEDAYRLMRNILAWRAGE
ncbi:MAG: DUF4159 domain-containing protein [Phycisphaerae bacterium]